MRRLGFAADHAPLGSSQVLVGDIPRLFLDIGHPRGRHTRQLIPIRPFSIKETSSPVPLLDIGREPAQGVPLGRIVHTLQTVFSEGPVLVGGPQVEVSQRRLVQRAGPEVQRVFGAPGFPLGYLGAAVRRAGSVRSLCRRRASVGMRAAFLLQQVVLQSGASQQLHSRRRRWRGGRLSPGGVLTLPRGAGGAAVLLWFGSRLGERHHASRERQTGAAAARVAPTLRYDFDVHSTAHGW